MLIADIGAGFLIRNVSGYFSGYHQDPDAVEIDGRSWRQILRDVGLVHHNFRELRDVAVTVRFKVSQTETVDTAVPSSVVPCLC